MSVPKGYVVVHQVGGADVEVRIEAVSAVFPTPTGGVTILVIGSALSVTETLDEINALLS